MSIIEHLRVEHFPELPSDCGKQAVAGLPDIDGYQDWSELGTTGGQLRIEKYLDRLGVRGKSIWHVGVGNSGLALRFVEQGATVFGTTITAAEAEKASSLDLRNYRAVLHNKYLPAGHVLPGPFDFIVDNNMTGFCCCMRHLGAMLEVYSSNLAADGQIVTDRRGLAWTTSDSRANARWSFTLEDLGIVASAVGLHAYRVDEDIYVLARDRPARSTLTAEVAYVLRRGRSRLVRLIDKLAFRVGFGSRLRD